MAKWSAITDPSQLQFPDPVLAWEGTGLGCYQSMWSIVPYLTMNNPPSAFFFSSLFVFSEASDSVVVVPRLC
jgi:hypothetical protein